MSPKSLFLVLLLVSACSKSTATPTEQALPSASVAAAPTPSAPAPAAAAPVPAKVDGFDAKAKLKDGKEVEYRSAAVFQYQGSSALHLVASTHKVTCAEVTSDEEYKLLPNEDRVHLIVAPLLHGDGSKTPAVMQFFHFTKEGTASYAVRNYADVRLGSTDPAHTVNASIGAFKSAASTGISVEGTIIAEGCGTVKGPEQAEDAPKQRPQSKLSLTVAKKKFDVRGAVYFPDRNQIVLSTHAYGCSPTSIESEVDLYLATDGSTGRFGGLGIEDVVNKDITNGLKIEIGKAQKEFVPAKINGKFEIESYSVEVSGSVELLSCE